MKSVLIGNGFDIQFGGQAYSNRFIMMRLIVNAKSGKYDSLMGGTIKGDEIVEIFKRLLELANEVLAGEYDDLHDKDLDDAICDFKNRFHSKQMFGKYFEIPLEDWFMILQIFYHTNKDLANQSIAAKQGLERIILDAIYNDGVIQTLHRNANKSVQRYLKSFDNVFTLNYDRCIDELCGHPVFHLHGQFDVLADSENPNVPQGYHRKRTDQTVVMPGFEHCFCNALINYSGELKLKQANANETYRNALDQIQNEDWCKNEDNKRMIEEITNAVPDFVNWIDIYRVHPKMQAATDYHFRNLLSLTGKLHIIGMSPQNDGHIFRCIKDSQIEKVVFYRYGNDPVNLPINKEVVLKDVSTLWRALNADIKHYNCNVKIPHTKEGDDYILCLNALSFDDVTLDEIENELKGIPTFVSEPICKEAFERITTKSQIGLPKDVDDLQNHFLSISQIALREGIHPSVLFILVFNYMNSHDLSILSKK